METEAIAWYDCTIKNKAQLRVLIVMNRLNKKRSKTTPPAVERVQDYNSSLYKFVFMFIAALFIWAMSFDLYKDIKAETWPTIMGSISMTYLQSSFKQGDQETMSGYAPIFEPFRTKKLTFSYEVGGLTYESSNKSFGFTFSEELELAPSDDKNRPKVKVYYNPSDPNDAVLIPGPKTINIGLLVLSIFAMFLTIKYVKQGNE